MSISVDLTVKPVGVSVGISPMCDAVVIEVDGQPPIGLTPQQAFVLAARLSDAVQQLLDAAKQARPQ